MSKCLMSVKLSLYHINGLKDFYRGYTDQNGAQVGPIDTDQYAVLSLENISPSNIARI